MLRFKTIIKEAVKEADELLDLLINEAPQQRKVYRIAQVYKTKQQIPGGSNNIKYFTADAANMYLHIYNGIKARYLIDKYNLSSEKLTKSRVDFSNYTLTAAEKSKIARMARSVFNKYFGQEFNYGSTKEIGLRSNIIIQYYEPQYSTDAYVQQPDFNEIISSEETRTQTQEEQPQIKNTVSVKSSQLNTFLNKPAAQPISVTMKPQEQPKQQQKEEEKEQPTILQQPSSQEQPAQQQSMQQAASAEQHTTTQIPTVNELPAAAKQQNIKQQPPIPTDLPTQQTAQPPTPSELPTAQPQQSQAPEQQPLPNELPTLQQGQQQQNRTEEENNNSEGEINNG